MSDNVKTSLKAAAVEAYRALLAPFLSRPAGHGGLSKKTVENMVAGYEGGWLEGYNAGFEEGQKAQEAAEAKTSSMIQGLINVPSFDQALAALPEFPKLTEAQSLERLALLAENVLSFAEDMSGETVLSIAQELVDATLALDALGNPEGTQDILSLWEDLLQAVLDDPSESIHRGRFQKACEAVQILLPKE